MHQAFKPECKVLFSDERPQGHRHGFRDLGDLARHEAMWCLRHFHIIGNLFHVHLNAAGGRTEHVDDFIAQFMTLLSFHGFQLRKLLE